MTDGLKKYKNPGEGESLVYFEKRKFLDSSRSKTFFFIQVVIAVFCFCFCFFCSTLIETTKEKKDGRE